MPRPPTRPIPCLTCGYDLRGLPPTAPCPECNQPAERAFSAAASLPDPAALARALRLLALAGLAGPLALLAAFLAPIHPLYGSVGAAIACPLVLLAGAIVSAMGWRRLARPLASIHPPSLEVDAHLAARCSDLLALILAATLAVVLHAAGGLLRNAPNVPDMTWFFVAAVPVAGVLWIVRAFLAFMLLDALGQRLASRFATKLRMLTTVHLIINALGILAASSVHSFSPRIGAPLWIAILISWGVLFLVVPIAAAVLADAAAKRAA